MREFRSESIPQPRVELDLKQLEAPLDLEIGAGQGLHAIQYARANPGRTLVAIERTREKFERFASRCARHPELKRLIALHADAVSVVSFLLAPDSLERVFLLYPNPYPKAKQANLRWHNSPFLSELQRKMKSGAELTLATNLNWYADEAAEKMSTRGFRLLERRLVDRSIPPRTHFEKKYLERGETCHNLIFISGN